MFGRIRDLGHSNARGWIGVVGVALLLLLHWAMAVSGIDQKSATFDEVAHQTGGYSYWLTGDFRLHPENGNLPQRLAALPLLFGDFRMPDLDQPAWWSSDVWKLGEQLFYSPELANDLDAMLWRGRALMAVTGCAVGLLVFVWSRRLFGDVGALISLVLSVFSPTLLAHGPLMTSDATLGLLLLAGTGAVWLQMHRISIATLLGGALILGLLSVAKMSALVILPVTAVLLLIRLSSGRPLAVRLGPLRQVCSRPRQAAVLAGVAALDGLIVVAILWTFYGFRYSAFEHAEPGRDHFAVVELKALRHGGPVNGMIAFAGDHHLLPEAYLQGLARVRTWARGRRAFMNGEYSVEGWPSFFPYAFMIKTPLSTLLLLILGASAAAVHWGRQRAAGERRAWRALTRNLYRGAPLLVLVGVYGAFAIGANLAIGHRHLLPIYPGLFVLAGASAYWCRIRLGTGLICLLLLSLVLESACIWPHYLAYFNMLAGGPEKGYRHLVNSSLDWGQDLPGLKRWLVEHRLEEPGALPVYFSYFGNADPDHYGIRAWLLPSHGIDRPKRLPRTLTAGVYCISATMLQMVYFRPMGHWTALHEQAYRATAAEVDRFLKADEPRELIEARPVGYWPMRFELYENLRFGRLASYLRSREPDDHVGYSILIYRLTSQEVEEALSF